MKHLCALAVLLSISLTAAAAPPTDQSLLEMMRVMQVEQMLNQMFTQMDSGMMQGMEQGLKQSLKGQEITPEQRKQMEMFRQKMSGIMKDELSFAKLKDLYLQVYRETFTQEEVNSIVAFYGSPGGQAMVAKGPVAMQKAGTLMQARMGPMMQRLQALQEEFTKSVEKK